MGRKALSPAANQCVSHHAVHGEVAVLGLQLHSMGVVVADLCVACQEQTLVVHDPVEHLKHDDKYTQRKNINKKNESTDTQGLGSLLTPADCCKNRHKQLGLSRVGKPERVCSLLQCSNIYPGQHTEKWTASIKSILSGSLREQLVAYGVLATSSYYCSVSKTAARSVLLQPAILFYSLQHRSVHFSPCLFLFCDAAVIARAVCVAARVGGGAPE